MSAFIHEKGPALSQAAAEPKNDFPRQRKVWAAYAPSAQTWQGFWLGFACAELGALGALVGQLIFNMVRT
jgi:hypothetical protein